MVPLYGSGASGCYLIPDKIIPWRCGRLVPRNGFAGGFGPACFLPMGSQHETMHCVSLCSTGVLARDSGESPRAARHQTVIVTDGTGGGGSFSAGCRVPNSPGRRSGFPGEAYGAMFAALGSDGTGQDAQLS